MDTALLPLFLLVVFLILLDAAMGYHLVPLLCGVSPDNSTPSGVAVRVLLAAMVALYTFLACLAWSRGSRLFLLLVGGAVCLDIAGQLILRNRKRRSPPSGGG